MTLVRWTDPFQDFVQLQERINRVFAEPQGRDGGSWVPPVDIY